MPLCLCMWAMRDGMCDGGRVALRQQLHQRKEIFYNPQTCGARDLNCFGLHFFLVSKYNTAICRWYPNYQTLRQEEKINVYFSSWLRSAITRILSTGVLVRGSLHRGASTGTLHTGDLTGWLGIRYNCIRLRLPRPDVGDTVLLLVFPGYVCKCSDHIQNSINLSIL